VANNACIKELRAVTVSSCRKQAFTQACAFPSPFCGERDFATSQVKILEGEAYGTAHFIALG